jgi:hypothetical protein
MEELVQRFKKIINDDNQRQNYLKSSLGVQSTNPTFNNANKNQSLPKDDLIESINEDLQFEQNSNHNNSSPNNSKHNNSSNNSSISESPPRKKRFLLSHHNTKEQLPLTTSSALSSKNKFKTSQTNNKFSSSEMLSSFKHKKITKSLSESQMLKPSSFSNSTSAYAKFHSKSLSKDKSDNNETNPTLLAIAKTIQYINKNKDNLNSNKLLEMLSEISISYDKTINTNENNTQKELIMQTKYETAEKMMKNYELKYLTAERDKNTLTKNYNDLQNKFNLLQQQYEINLKEIQELSLLKKNNDVLIKTNEDLHKVINDMNVKNDFVKKKYEEEINTIKQMFNDYHTKLEFVESKLYTSSSSSNHIQNIKLNTNSNSNNSFIKDEIKTLTLNNSNN